MIFLRCLKIEFSFLYGIGLRLRFFYCKLSLEYNLCIMDRIEVRFNITRHIFLLVKTIIHRCTNLCSDFKLGDFIIF